MHRFILVAVLGYVHVATGYQFTDETSCSLMYPHGILSQPQTTIAPYEIKVSSLFYEPYTPLRVAISALKTPILNVMIGLAPKCIGSGCGPALSDAGSFFFMRSTPYKFINCNGQQRTAVATSKDLTGSSFSVVWRTRDPKLYSDFQFIATIVKDQNEWWTNVRSPVIKRKPDTNAPAPTAPVVTEPTPVVTEPAPVVTEPAPVVTEHVPVVTEPAPIVTEPAPVVTEHAPVVTEPAPETSAGGTDGGCSGLVFSGSTIPVCRYHYVIMAIGIQMLWCLVVQLKH